ncbi:uncharacterized protein LOC110688165 [Chenopodium quinoa]|uniref:Coiled-coil domain-containing protein R3HCC1L n=1 Tax=Chenopodium quinoa TaxID=63459 RepID=A0A803KR97_CHEQI|nr:uncharacterized protein LOC110688165 [Chenopodium quinoa]
MESEAEKNWSEQVEDLVDSGDIEAAISLLESLILKLETLNSSDSQLQLASALLEVAKLYSCKGLSLKSDDARSRASAINLRSLSPSSISFIETSATEEKSGVSNSNDLPWINLTRDGDYDLCSKSSTDNVAPQESSDDDWEAIADRAPDELLPAQCLPEVSKLTLYDTEVEKKVPNRRGRGTFTYKKQGMYSDEQINDSISCDTSDENVHEKSEKILEGKKSLYGTHHVLVLDGFHPSTTTIDLERLFEGFRDRGFAIRWVKDTLALGVFRTPSTALEALNSVRCSFKVRVLEEDDPMMGSISIKDLDPPRQRPKTSARTAQRLIAQELGVKLPSTFGSTELRKQEDARRNRIVTRQNLRDEVWGPDDTN